jgi:hypothetical protein
VRDVFKIGSVYRVHKWNGTYNGMSIVYSTSTDGANFATETLCTIYGPTQVGTGVYGASAQRTTGGIFLMAHRNDGNNLQSMGTTGMATSTAGETIWWDIDTGDPDPLVPNVYSLNHGDPLVEPHTWGTWYHDHNNYISIRTACDGNEFIAKGSFTEFSGQMWEMGQGLAVGTAGSGNGGDDYIWLADNNSSNTEGVGDSLLSGMGMNGLSGPSLRNHIAGWWTGWTCKLMPLKAGADEMVPATKFAMFYSAAWDTDSSGGAGYDTIGVGRSTLWLTRNKADLNYDGTVNFSDIAPFSTAYGSTSGVSGNYNPEADFNSDGVVDFSDISPLSTRYGSDCSFQ